MTDTPTAYPSPAIVHQAVANAAAAMAPRALGDFGQSHLVPDGWHVESDDVRKFEMHPRERHGSFSFVDVVSFADYVNRYRVEDSLVYAIDVGASPKDLLDRGHTALVAVLDDYPVDATSSRSHKAVLELKPTPAGRRWGGVFDRWIDQETLLDLVVDGAREILRPDAGELRDLAASLHAIRTAEVESVIRTGGEGTIKVAANVQLRAGTGRDVTFPEQLRVVFEPFHRSQETPVAIDVRIKARVSDKHVHFQLTAPDLGDQLFTVIEHVAGLAAERVELTPLWRPSTAGV